MENLKSKNLVRIFVFVVIEIFFVAEFCGFSAADQSFLKETNYFLSPLVKLDREQLQNVFLQLSKGTIDGKNIDFSLDAYVSDSNGGNNRPRRKLAGRELEDFWGTIEDIESMIKILGKQDAGFETGLWSGDDEKIIKELLEPEKRPEEIDLVRDKEMIDKLKSIFEKGLARISRLQREKRKESFVLKRNLKFLAERVKQSNALLIPRMPIKSMFINEELHSYLTTSLRKKIIDCITWKEFRPDGYMGGRKIVIKLEQPITLKNGKTIRALEIKGVVYKQDSEIMPPL